jgi:hypothetical protein
MDIGTPSMEERGAQAAYLEVDSDANCFSFERSMGEEWVKWFRLRGGDSDW